MSIKKLPKYAHHKGTGQARVRINGKDIYLGVHGSPESYRRYSEELAAWQSTAEESPDELTIRQLTMLYAEFAKKHYRKNGKPTSKLAVVKTALRHLNKQFRNLSASELTPKRFKAIRQRLIEDDLARTTINDYMACIRRLVRWAVGEELLAPNKLVAINSVPDLQENRSEARETEPVRVVADSYIDVVKDHVSEPVWAMIQLQRFSGMRPGEARIVRTCDLNTAGNVWEYRPHSHKTEHKGKERLICLGPQAQAILKEWIRPGLEEYLFCPPRSDGSKSYTKDQYRRAIVRGCERAFAMPERLRKIDRKSADVEELRREAAEWREKNCWSPNQLRHNFLTVARREGGIEVASTLAGHSDLSVTRLYAETSYDAARAIIAKIG